MQKERTLQWNPITEFTMPLQIYPNKEQQQVIQAQLDALRIFCNEVLYDIYNSFAYTDERIDKKTGKTKHLVWSATKIGKKENYRKYIANDPRLKCLPISALTVKGCGAICDIVRSFNRKGDDGNLHMFPVEDAKPHYYNRNHPRTSITCQIPLASNANSTSRNFRQAENPKVGYIKFPKVGELKARGWNYDLRFGENGDMNFFEYVQAHPEKSVTVTIKVDGLGHYYADIGFSRSVDRKGKETGFWTWRPYAEKTGNKAGYDLGTTTLATGYDATQDKIFEYENPHFLTKDRKDGGFRDTRQIYDRKVSTAYGWSNPDFRADHKAAMKRGEDLQPSNNYVSRRRKQTMLNQKIQRKRNDYQHKVTREIIDNYGTISTETLRVESMMGHEKAKEELGSNRKAATRNSNLSDAAMSSFMEKLKYKSKWANRTLTQIDCFDRSTGVCPYCDYVLPHHLDTSIREWDCPQCGRHILRDAGAAVVIHKKGELIRASAESSTDE